MAKNILPISCRGETKSGFLRYVMWGMRGGRSLRFAIH